MKNKGRWQHRFSSEPLEKAFAEEWERRNTNYIDGRLDGRGVLDYLLADDLNNPCGEVTDRDRVVAATVVQWLGSSVGKCFIGSVLGIDLYSIIAQKKER